jgi:uncharacterized membrane protein YqjE
VLVLGLVALISAEAGPAYRLVVVAMMLGAAAAIHLWWLLRHSVNSWTVEPKDRYYEFDGMGPQAVTAV